MFKVEVFRQVIVFSMALPESWSCVAVGGVDWRKTIGSSLCLVAIVLFLFQLTVSLVILGVLAGVLR